MMKHVSFSFRLEKRNFYIDWKMSCEWIVNSYYTYEKSVELTKFYCFHYLFYDWETCFILNGKLTNSHTIIIIVNFCIEYENCSFISNVVMCDYNQVYSVNCHFSLTTCSCILLFIIKNKINQCTSFYYTLQYNFNEDKLNRKRYSINLFTQIQIQNVKNLCIDCHLLAALFIAYAWNAA